MYIRIYACIILCGCIRNKRDQKVATPTDKAFYVNDVGRERGRARARASLSKRTFALNECSSSSSSSSPASFLPSNPSPCPLGNHIKRLSEQGPPGLDVIDTQRLPTSAHTPSHIRTHKHMHTYTHARERARTHAHISPSAQTSKQSKEERLDLSFMT